MTIYGIEMALIMSTMYLENMLGSVAIVIKNHGKVPVIKRVVKSNEREHVEGRRAKDIEHVEMQD